MTESFLNKPVFLCGHRKTGTTMLLALLDFHPELLVYPADSGFFYAYFPLAETEKYSAEKKIEAIKESAIKNLEKELNDLLEKDRKELNFSINQFALDFTDLFKQTKKSPKETLQALFSAFYKNSPQEKGKIKYFVEKTTSTEIYALEIADWFKGAKFIHLIRDPRDNWASLKSGWQQRYQRFNDDPRRLLQSMADRGKLGMEMADCNQNILGKERYLITRYEDLVKEPEKYLKENAQFLGIEYQASMLVPTVLGKWWKGNNFEGKTFSGPSAVDVGRWPERISKEEAHFIEFHFAALMERFGYELTSKKYERVRAASEHYKWYNFAQQYSFKPKTNEGAN